MGGNHIAGIVRCDGHGSDDGEGGAGCADDGSCIHVGISPYGVSARCLQKEDQFRDDRLCVALTTINMIVVYRQRKLRPVLGDALSTPRRRELQNVPAYDSLQNACIAAARGEIGGRLCTGTPATDIAEGNGWRHEGRDVAAALGRNSSRA
ncbi:MULTISPECIES: hypothetical protein [Sinorhizobium]|uniref:hypothetical protein n=1 Tax=Sinorhizobium TaxID=28105 RepID=UPI0015965FFF|nr:MULTISPECIES: hypothetical protein [Sinorhizobium]